MATKKNLELAREKLNPNNLEAGLPGREFQSDELYNFLFERLKIRQTAAAKKAKIDSGQVANIKGRHINKTMFVCGVPGTGKTATILSVVEKMEKLSKAKSPQIHPFETVYVNGQHLSAPEKVYSEILYKLSNELCNHETAQDKLEKIFRESGDYVADSKSRRAKKSTKTKRVTDSFKIVIIDELDLLYNERRQSVFYSLFDWPTSADSKMILIAIANAMDLPERFMRGRVCSRVGENKLVFESYTSDCLERILKARLGQDLMDKCFEKTAIVVATKRIGRTTGDARRILDTCRLAIDKTIENKLPKVNAAMIDKVGFQNLDLQRTNYVETCPRLELMVLKCVLIETNRVGEENIEAIGVFRQLVNMMSKDSFFRGYDIGPSKFHTILNTLAGVSMIYLENDKDILKKRLYIKDASPAFKDLIKTRQINTT